MQNSNIKRHDLSEKVQIIQRYEAGANPTTLCREYGISRTLFYRWLQRYKSSNKNIGALDKARPSGKDHWRYLNVSESLLEIIAEHPEYSLKKISVALEVKLGKKLLGTHGIYNRLKQWNLTSQAKRLDFSRQQEQKEKPPISQESKLTRFLRSIYSKQ